MRTRRQQNTTWGQWRPNEAEHLDRLPEVRDAGKAVLQAVVLDNLITPFGHSLVILCCQVPSLDPIDVHMKPQWIDVFDVPTRHLSLLLCCYEMIF